MERNPLATSYNEPRLDLPAQTVEERHITSSGVAWGAVIGGAFVIAASYLILLALGAGFGLSSVSAWANEGISAKTFGWAAIIWLLLIEIVSSGLGGYLTGRLRTKWRLLHTDEVYFRDTANGLLAWSVALVVSVTFLASALATMGGVGQVGATTAMTANGDYYVDAMFRTDQSANQKPDPAAEGEAARILANSLRQAEMPTLDQTYLTRLVAANTGLSLPEADKRVSDIAAQARQAEDTARKDTARVLFWLFISLVLGAFSAAYAATIGGRQRDHVRTI